MKNKLFILVVILTLLTFLSSFADILTTNKGEEFKGNLLSISEGKVRFSVYGTSEIKDFTTEEVLRIELSKRRPGDEFSKVDLLKDPILDEARNVSVSPMAYPNSNFVNLYKEYNYKLNPDLSSEVEIRMIMRCLNEDGRGIATRSFSYLGDIEDMNVVWGRTVKPDGSLFHVEENAIAKTSVFSINPDYDRLKSLKLTVPEVKVGDITDIKVVKTRKKNDTFNPFYVEGLFRETDPVIKKVVKIYIPDNMNFTKVEKRLDLGEIEFKETKEKGWRVLTWTSKNSKEVINETAMPPGSMIFPKIAVSLEGQWEDIKSEYKEALTNSLDINDDFIKRVKTVSKDAKSDFEILHNIYDFVAKEIKIVWVSPTSYDYRPKKLSEINKNNHGNSLDKSFYLYAMLQHAGLKPDFLLVSPSFYGDFFNELPSLEQFSAMIVKVELEGKTYYLYPINETSGLFELPSSFQNRPALNVTGTNLFETIPVYDKDLEYEKNLYKMDLKADGTIFVEKRYIVNGRSSSLIRGFKDLMKDEIDKKIQAMVNSADPKAELISYEIKNMTRLDKPAELVIKYKIKDYALVAGNKYFVFRLPEIKYGAWEVGKPTRDFPLKWDGVTYSTNSVELTFPSGYKLYYHPGSLEETVNDEINYKADYKVKGNKIDFTDEYYRIKDFFGSEVYGAYKNLVERRAKYSKEWIILER
ncbi:MAG TPA: DUF3857 domain-containing protein [Firmicutes bacterium]|nr:DUF3857 domain-containing protein [Bacillota bacterium]